jgi:exopolysaccharide biosynthesis polyprenyl glycosylphosphotransferase
MVADGTVAAALFAILSRLRFGPEWVETWATASVDAIFAIGTFAVLWPSVLWLSGLYRLRARWTVRTELVDLVRAGLFAAAIAFAVLFLAKLPDVSRLFLLTLFPSQVALTLGTRLALRMAFAFLRARGHNTRYMLIVGAGPAAQRFADRVERHAELGLLVVGHLQAAGETPQVTRAIHGTIEDIERILHERVIDEVAICLPRDAFDLAEPITRLCEEEGRIVRLPLDDVGLPLAGASIEELDGLPVMSFVHGPDRTLALVGKRLLDFVLAGLALLVLSPLLAAIAIWIRVVDGGPVMFRQMRVGLHGRPLRLLKFRTMVSGAEERLSELEALNEVRGHAFKVTHDPRLTRTGGRLRRASLDELPQLWNVLRGEMSLVGPRPPLPREVAGYDVWHRRRLSMKPGITGLWQVSARREQDFDRWVEIDLDYIDRWSIWLDVKIILRTIPAMILQQGR